MPYEITAARKRPQSFEQFYGQEFVSATLRASLESGRIAHAYLFSGPRGCGKTSAARLLAKALNCEKGPTAKPCGVCRSCVEIARGGSLDVIEIDGASNTSVDNVRQIKDEVLFPPNGGRYKVYIIDEVHMLSNSAFNALLKTIEEPPPYIVFIFATTELHKVPATIKSRCQQFAFRLFKIELIQSLLAEAAAEVGVKAESDALLWIAKESGGSLRDAYTLFDQVVSFADGSITQQLIRDKLGLTGMDSLGALFRAGAEGDAKAALSALDEILERGVSPEQLASECAEYCRSLLLIKNGIDKPSLLGSPVSAYDEKALEVFSTDRLERALAGLLDLYRNLRYTVDPRFELELAVAKLCRLPEYVSPTELASVVASLRSRLAPGSMPALPSAPAGMGQAPAGARRGGSGDERSPAAQSPAGAEKKKPELPRELSAAFSSLAATAESMEASGAEPESAAVPAPQDPVAPAQTPSPPKPRVMRDHVEADAAPDDDDDEDESLEGPDASPALARGADESLAGGGAELRAAVIEALGRSSPLLKTGLSSSLPWRLEEGRLVLPFRSGMEESVVRPSVADIAAKVSELAGKALKVELKVEPPSRPRASAQASGAGAVDPIAVVERVFRGARLPDARRGESGELR